MMHFTFNRRHTRTLQPSPLLSTFLISLKDFVKGTSMTTLGYFGGHKKSIQLYITIHTSGFALFPTVEEHPDSFDIK